MSSPDSSQPPVIHRSCDACKPPVIPPAHLISGNSRTLWIILGGLVVIGAGGLFFVLVVAAALVGSSLPTTQTEDETPRSHETEVKQIQEQEALRTSQSQQQHPTVLEESREAQEIGRAELERQEQVKHHAKGSAFLKSPKGDALWKEIGHLRNQIRAQLRKERAAVDEKFQKMNEVGNDVAGAMRSPELHSQAFGFALRDAIATDIEFKESKKLVGLRKRLALCEAQLFELSGSTYDDVLKSGNSPTGRE